MTALTHMNSFTCLLFLSIPLAIYCVENDGVLPKVGIIGAGVGGTSSAYYLRQLFGDDLEIDIFESAKVGGRAALINIDGENYEAGASIIHGKNKYMAQFFDQFFPGQARISRGDSGRMGFYGKDGMVLETSEWSAVTLGKLVWRYGFDLYNLKHWLDKIMTSNFNRIYMYQDKGMSFTTVEDLLKAMGDEMFNLTRHSMEDVLLEAGFSKAFVSEFGTAAVRTNYGQTTTIHGFIGAVSLYGVDSDLWAVPGGNEQIPIKLLDSSKASLIKGTVTSIAQVKGGQGVVSYEVEYDKEGKTGTREYDILIMATPVHGSNQKISFIDFPDSVIDFKQDYHHIVNMFVHGNINKTTFGIADENDFPRSLLTVDDEVVFNSMDRKMPVSVSDDNKSNRGIWQAFFNKVPTQDQVDSLFENRTDLRFVEWLAYPSYNPQMEMPPFVLSEHFYYVNAIESAASAMEMSVIGAKNVALLAYNHFHSHLDRIDELNIPEDKSGIRSEL